MAIIKRIRSSGTKYQVKYRGSDGKWITHTFDTKALAERKEAELKLQKLSGGTVTSHSHQLTVSDYIRLWDEETRGTSASAGWRGAQLQMLRDHVEPVVGAARLKSVTPALVSRVLREVAAKGRSPQMQLHVYTLMHKVFGDAVELFRYLPSNPVIKKLRPKLPVKEARYLTYDEVLKLLRSVDGRPYEIAIWLGVYLGLRIGEVQALKWEHVDFGTGKIHIRATYVRREDRFKDYPKGRKWHSVTMPQELRAKLLEAQKGPSSDYVVTSESGAFLSYHTYQKAIRRYCREAGIKEISSHGLRHSASEIYMQHGASRDDLRMLFAHSCGSVTDRYVHDKGERLDKVANVVQLFPRPPLNRECSPDVPRESLEAVDAAEARC